MMLMNGRDYELMLPASVESVVVTNNIVIVDGWIRFIYSRTRLKGCFVADGDIIEQPNLQVEELEVLEALDLRRCSI